MYWRLLTLLSVAAQSELATQIWPRWALHPGSGDREIALRSMGKPTR